jgi:hypothetical protein
VKRRTRAFDYLKPQWLRYTVRCVHPLHIVQQAPGRPEQHRNHTSGLDVKSSCAFRLSASSTLHSFSSNQVSALTLNVAGPIVSDAPPAFSKSLSIEIMRSPSNVSWLSTCFNSSFHLLKGYGVTTRLILQGDWSQATGECTHTHRSIS